MKVERNAAGRGEVARNELAACNTEALDDKPVACSIVEVAARTVAEHRSAADCQRQSAVKCT